MKKLLLGLFLAGAMVSLSSCAVNSDTEGQELVRRIQELEQIITSLKEEQQAQNDKLLDYEAKILLLNAQIENLSGQPIDYTAERPVYANLQNAFTYAEFDYREDDTVSFEKFLNFYREDVKQKTNEEFCLWAPLKGEYDWHPNCTRVYSVYADSLTDGMLVNPMICERMMMYSEVLGDRTMTEGEGHVPWSIDLKTYSAPVPKTIEFSSLKLIYGNNIQDDYWNYYVNLYFDETCVATCYYNTNAYVSQIWFQKYFKNYIKE